MNIELINDIPKYYPFLYVKSYSVYFHNTDICNRGHLAEIDDDGMLCIVNHSGRNWELKLYVDKIGGSFKSDTKLPVSAYISLFELNIEVIIEDPNLLIIYRLWYLNSLIYD